MVMIHIYILFDIQEMSSNFLQRFKGKTQQISKDGVQNILGSKDPDTVYDPNKQFRQRNYNSVANKKPNKSTNSNFLPQKPKAQPIKAASITTNKDQKKKAENPFLISNPFYLDEEQRQRDEIERREKAKLEQERKKAQKEILSQKNQPTRTTITTKSLEKKNGKEWVKLGGLGANIGGDQWVEKKKKQQKMQEFASQVKNSNAERIRPPKPDRKREEPKQINSRQKALEYSKNIPKPVVRREQQEQISEQIGEKAQPKDSLSQLEMYAMRHEQLKKMINNNHY